MAPISPRDGQWTGWSLDDETQLLFEHPVTYPVQMDLAHALTQWAERAERDVKDAHTISRDREYLSGYARALYDVVDLLMDGSLLPEPVVVAEAENLDVPARLPRWLGPST